MKNISKEFRRALHSDERNYLVYADITLADSTVLNLTNSEIWTGGFSYEEAVGDDNSFTSIGSVVIGSATIIINNIYETYSDYDFTNAEVVLYLGMQLTSGLEKFKVGTYTVDETNYNDATIRLTLLDNIEQFDRPYSISTLTYPATLDEIVRDACTRCGVTFSTSSYQFPNYNLSIPTRPEDESITFREILSWAATIAGCFVKCNPNGQLELKWFDTTLLDSAASDLDGGTFNPWSGGDTYDGGTFNPWSTGDTYDGGSFTDSRNVHYIYSLYSQNVSVDDVVITGVSVNVKDEASDATSDIITYSTGTDGYVVQVQENDFITKLNAQTIVNYLGTKLIGLRFRKLDVTQASDPSIESGDVAIVVDRKQNVYRILVTRVNFSLDGPQTIVCGADTPSRNSATRYSSTTKSYVEARKLLKLEKTSWEDFEEELDRKIANSSGLYFTKVTDTATQSTKIYYHDRPNMEDSSIVMLFSDVGFTLTANYQDTNPTWYGMTVDGTFLASVIQTISLFFDYARGGTLVLGGSNNTNGLLRILNASGTEIGRWGKDGISWTATSSSMTAAGYLTITGGKIANFEIVTNALTYGSPYGISSLTQPSQLSGQNHIQIGTDGVLAEYHGSSVTYCCGLVKGNIIFYNRSNIISLISSQRDSSNNAIIYLNAVDYSSPSIMYQLATFSRAGSSVQSDLSVQGLLTANEIRTPTLKVGPSDSNNIAFSRMSFSGVGDVLYIDSPVLVERTSYMSGYIFQVGGGIYATGSITGNSDERRKDIIDWDEEVDSFIQELEPICFTWKDDIQYADKKTHFGLGAQRTIELLEKHGLNDTALAMHYEESDEYGVTYDELAPMMLPSIQKNRKMIEELQKENAELKQQVEELTNLTKQLLAKLDS